MPKKPVSSCCSSQKDELLVKKREQGAPLRKGEMVIWGAKQFHGSSANVASKPRVAQFVRCAPANEWLQKLGRLSPMRACQRWPELKLETERSLAGCTEEEVCIAGLLKWLGRRQRFRAGKERQVCFECTLVSRSPPARQNNGKENSFSLSALLSLLASSLPVYNTMLKYNDS